MSTKILLSDNRVSTVVPNNVFQDFRCKMAYVLDFKFGRLYELWQKTDDDLESAIYKQQSLQFSQAHLSLYPEIHRLCYAHSLMDALDAETAAKLCKDMSGIDVDSKIYQLFSYASGYGVGVKWLRC